MPYFLVSSSHSTHKTLASLKCMKFLQADFLAVAQFFMSPFTTSEKFIRNTLAKSVAASSTLITMCKLDIGG